jgi:hypothetical protein
MADTERLRRDLYAAFKNRALMYWHVFDELRRALGEPQAIALLSSAMAWQEAGVADADIAADTWQPGRDGCCHLHVRPGRAH